VPTGSKRASRDLTQPLRHPSTDSHRPAYLSAEHSQTKSQTRCILARDAGYTRADALGVKYSCMFFAKGCCPMGSVSSLASPRQPEHRPFADAPPGHATRSAPQRPVQLPPPDPAGDGNPP
jgi:hypothetical protein